MSSLVLDLQKKAMDPNISIIDLLRNALIVAKKLKINDFQEWINHELNGYPKNIDVPPYRKAVTEIKAHNPHYGFIPIVMEDHELKQTLSNIKLTQAISNIYTLSQNDRESLEAQLPPEVAAQLMNTFDVPLFPTRIIQTYHFKNVIDSVRNAVLEWALDLEEKGIVGDDISFSEKEKQTASAITYNIQNYIGTIDNSQVQQGTLSSTQNNYLSNHQKEKINNILEEIKVKLSTLKIEEDKMEEVLANVQTVESQVKLKSTNKTIVKEAFNTIRNIFEGITASHIATELNQQINEIISNITV